MNNIIRFWLALLALFYTTAHAETWGLAPDTAAGKRRAAVCFACHNVDGVAKIPGVPNLAGQQRDYLANAILAYRDGKTRQNPTMNAMAAPLSDRDVVNIAAYFSQLHGATGGGGGEGGFALIPAASPGVQHETVAAPVTAAPAVPAAPAAASPARSGEVIYSSVCFACHATGAAGAPKVGDKGEWLPRIAQGDATLLHHALLGFKAMPPRGGCSACSDAEIKAAVSYMTAKSR
ncbi:TPA: c-type cytochrome [Burkholderia aenigmatica]|uniref:c-type cytochrome n=1 Tax=Burkholderia sp. AU45251 TaxID=3059204 RepID=UPI002654784B|nr:c-type cytochrome [Burkholderia sp. AU45251]HDR9482555.1 c-type cytochrome [Burkholderia aenigmatica]MDN7517715.1 c-type cytochrome [Burkholderia sp. AU45251]HDR9513502.1 c-type cytochrome [Burkholderia aenigmatica]HDR9590893.1 c-type cytochrome [Burkholderia aenigmatica]HDR9601681.1 c-type cytochrome [Burkholderia aenigmatica]